MESNRRKPVSNLSPAHGKHGDFAGLFQASFRKLWCVAAGIVGHSAAAEDVVQEAALVALGKFDQFQKQNTSALDVKAGDKSDDKPNILPQFTAWMAQIVRFVALNQYRKNRRNPVSSLCDGDESAHISAPISPAPLHLTTKGQLPALQQTFDDSVMLALRQVGDVARACLLLRTIESLDYRQIAQLLEIPEGTAMSHVHRARQLLRRQLSQMDGKIPGGRT
ncbi:MAG: RNA polymerase sigma factor [Phycisphaerales bacterium]|jgi:RNA polymerase sigma-70 factor (ECF subfamily)|nr:RNA polymerase sigma factor [Phycisphaerales bacterium]